MSDLADVLEFGQADDDVVLELFNSLNDLSNGYYGLINYGDEWWEAMNQDVWFSESVKEEWENVDWETFETTLEMITKLMIGTYVRLGKFTKGLNEISEEGKGYRPQRKKAGDIDG